MSCDKKVVTMSEITLRVVDMCLSDNTKMGDKAFEVLKKQLDLAINKVNRLQRIYKKQTGRSYVPNLYIDRNGER